MFIDSPTAWTSFKFEAPSYWTDGSQPPTLTLTTQNAFYNSSAQVYEIIGEVRNDHGTRVEFISPIATLYNQFGYVIGCDFTYINSTHLDPGQTSTFKFLISGNEVSNTASYRLQLDGNPK
jgi:hypothetical protein